VVDSTLWLAISVGLVAISITALFVVALPAVIELGRAARSAEKLFDTLNRELPPVLEAMRTTGQELSELTDGVGDSVEKAGQLVQQVDQSVQFVKQQAGQAKQTSRSVVAGARAAWRVLRQPPASPSAPSYQPSPPSGIAVEPMRSESSASRDETDTMELDRTAESLSPATPDLAPSDSAPPDLAPPDLAPIEQSLEQQ